MTLLTKEELDEMERLQQLRGVFSYETAARTGWPKAIALARQALVLRERLDKLKKRFAAELKRIGGHPDGMHYIMPPLKPAEARALLAALEEDG